MKKSILVLWGFAAFLGLTALQSGDSPVDPGRPLAEVLLALGEDPAPHRPDMSISGVSAEQGKWLVTKGIAAKPKGGTTGVQSKHFVCTSCHNIQREDPRLDQSDPQARLEYVIEQGLPFLQGTTLYGAVNRTRFYNGDYKKKYGSLVEAARNDIREAIQLCAVECSQGRRLEPWEMESILAYLWTIDLKLADLDLRPKEYDLLEQELGKPHQPEKAIALLRSKYLDGSPATFADPPEDRTKGYPEGKPGDPENGARIYEYSCLHCHEGERYSFFQLDDSQASFRFLMKHFPKYDRYSTYQVTRFGTSPLPGKRAYMPNYTLEKMSDQQLEDLRAFVRQEALR